MLLSDDPIDDPALLSSDPHLALAVKRLHRVQVTARWVLNGLVSLVAIPFGLWDLWAEIQLWRQHFTWVAVRYGLAFHPWATLAIVTSVALVTATLVWHSRNIIWGLPQKEQYRLQQQALKIREKGKRLLLWRWVWQDLV
ncbi:MAG: hypothetical protein ACO37W_04540 [Prochlorotrichaceae cyanobacterium]